MQDEVRSMRRYVSGESWTKQAESDQSKGVSAPPTMLSPSGAPLTALPKPGDCPAALRSLLEVVDARRSRRLFDGTPLTLAQLSYLLYCCQGYQKERPGQSYAALRTVPSAGCRHPLDTYVAARNITGLESGIYRFLPKEHALELVELHEADALRGLVAGAANGQRFCGDAPACIFWAADMYRCEWRYPMSAHKVVLLDAGHACQNLYLACEELNLGTCAVAAYRQEACDHLLHLDGENVFTVYLAPVGTPK